MQCICMTATSIGKFIYKFFDDIFAATFGFVTRFVSGTKDANGKYKYDWAWWFQRQVTMQEFRIGSLEYELV